MLKTLRLRTERRHAGQRLDAVVAEWLRTSLGRDLTKSTVRRLLMAGVVRIGGRAARIPGRVLEPGLHLEVRIDLSRLGGSRASEDRPLAVTPATILYEDDALIVVDKPSGLPTVPTVDPRRPSLVRALEDYLSRPDRKVRLGVHQRLDRDTSGVVLFAKDPSANPGLAEAFAAGAVEKVYEALTASPARRPPGRFEVSNTLGSVGGGRMGAVRDGGQAAATEFTVIEEMPGGLRLEARPRTGRKHQIRVHLADAGLPILGDPLYGSARGAADAPRAPRLMLHARRLSLPHPVTGTPLVVESPRPPDFLRVLESLRAGASAGSRGRRR